MNSFCLRTLVQVIALVLFTSTFTTSSFAGSEKLASEISEFITTVRAAAAKIPGITAEQTAALEADLATIEREGIKGGSEFVNWSQVCGSGLEGEALANFRALAADVENAANTGLSSELMAAYRAAIPTVAGEAADNVRVLSGVGGPLKILSLVVVAGAYLTSHKADASELVDTAISVITLGFINTKTANASEAADLARIREFYDKHYRDGLCQDAPESPKQTPAITESPEKDTSASFSVASGGHETQLQSLPQANICE